MDSDLPRIQSAASRRLRRTGVLKNGWSRMESPRRIRIQTPGFASFNSKSKSSSPQRDAFPPSPILVMRSSSDQSNDNSRSPAGAIPETKPIKKDGEKSEKKTLRNEVQKNFSCRQKNPTPPRTPRKKKKSQNDEEEEEHVNCIRLEVAIPPKALLSPFPK